MRRLLRTPARLPLLGVALLTLLAPITCSAASQGPRDPTSAEEDQNVGSFSWTNYEFVFSDDGQSAEYAISNPGQITYYIKATDFGFSIPSGSTIDGIKVEVEANEAFSAAQDYDVRLVKGGTVTGDNKAVGTGFSAAGDEYITYGGATDKWGTTWTVSDINGSGFGVAFSGVSTDAAGTMQVDHIRISIFYTPSTPVPEFSTWAMIFLLPACFAVLYWHRNLIFDGVR